MSQKMLASALADEQTQWTILSVESDLQFHCGTQIGLRAAQFTAADGDPSQASA